MIPEPDPEPARRRADRGLTPVCARGDRLGSDPNGTLCGGKWGQAHFCVPRWNRIARMVRRFSIAVLFISAFAAFPGAQQVERLDYAGIAQIRDEGLSRSQAMETLFWLTDRYGPRL